MSLPLLEQDVPGVTARVKSLSRSRQRLLAGAAAELALCVSPVEDARVLRAWVEFRAQSPEPGSRQQLQELVDELDDEAAALQVRLDAHREAGGSPKREGELVERYSRVYARARACEALLAALDSDLDDAVEGALYEANAALDHAPAAIGALVEAICEHRPEPVASIVRLLARR